MVVVSTFPIHPRVFGGQLRCFHLARQLARHSDVHIVSLTEKDQRSQQFTLPGGVRETTVVKSEAQVLIEDEVGARAGARVGDIVAATATDRTPDYLSVLRDVLVGADAVLLAHPYMLPWVRAVNRGVPVLYEAQNAEWRHKRSQLPESAERDTLLEVVRQVEAQSCTEALLISTPDVRDRDGLIDDHGVPSDRVMIVPNGAAVAEVAFVSGEGRRRARRRWLADLAAVRGWHGWRGIAVFVGSNHPPNAQACAWIEGLAERMPRIATVVVGGVGSVFDGREVPENMLLVGPVTELMKQGALAAASVALNPMTSGYGSNVKLPEYLAAGIPVVSTPLGARGFEVTDGIHLMLRELQDFDAAADELVGDGRLGDGLAAAGRRLVEERYSWPALAAPWCDRVLELIGAQPTGRASPDPALPASVLRMADDDVDDAGA